MESRESTTPTPLNRAEDAQVAFGVEVMRPMRERKRVAEALLSVISTAEYAKRKHTMLNVATEHQNPRSKDPEKWKDLEKTVWGAIVEGGTLEDVFKLVGEFTREHFDVPFLKMREIIRRAGGHLQVKAADDD